MQLGIKRLPLQPLWTILLPQQELPCCVQMNAQSHHQEHNRRATSWRSRGVAPASWTH
jgi:hypothetical protein